MHPDSVFYAFFSKHICTKKIVKRLYCIKNIDDNVVSTYTESEKDTLFMNSRKFPGDFPDFYRFSIEEPENTDALLVFTVTEHMPSFPGGDDARQRFLLGNMRYPQEAKEKGIQGTVYVTFIVEPDGSVSNVRVLRGIGGGCDEEAIRVVQMLPKWNPGTQSGKAVRVLFNMPLKFSLN
jgi:protein TonB